MCFVHVVARGVAHVEWYMLLSNSSVREIVIKISGTANPFHILINSAGNPLPQKKKVTFSTRGRVQNLVVTKKEKNTFKLKDFISQCKN